MSAPGVRPAGIVFVLFAVLAASSCSSGSSPKPVAVIPAPSSTSTSSSVASTSKTTAVGATTTSTSPGFTNWTTPPAKSDGTIAVAAFNTRLDAEKPTWASFPERIADEFVQRNKIDATQTATHLTALSPPAAAVTVTANGLADDSVHALRYELHLAQQPDQTWRLVTATWSQQCQPNRGHQNLTPASCI